MASVAASSSIGCSAASTSTAASCSYFSGAISGGETEVVVGCECSSAAVVTSALDDEPVTGGLSKIDEEAASCGGEAATGGVTGRVTAWVFSGTATSSSNSLGVIEIPPRMELQIEPESPVEKATKDYKQPPGKGNPTGMTECSQRPALAKRQNPTPAKKGLREATGRSLAGIANGK